VVDLTNKSGHACYLYGTPRLQKVSGPARRKEGWPSQVFGDYGSKPDYVTLSALGGRASVKLQFFPPGKKPSKGCDQTAVEGIVATFAPGSTFYVPMPKNSALCNQGSMQSFQVK
jgi:hypothetical protein